MIGGGEGRNSLVHVADAARATLAAVDRGQGIFNIVDDEPAPIRELVPHIAQLLGAKPPRKVPGWVARMVVGSYLVAASTSMPGASNAKAERDLGWQPMIPNWREGLKTYRDTSPD